MLVVRKQSVLVVRKQSVLVVRKQSVLVVRKQSVLDVRTECAVCKEQTGVLVVRNRLACWMQGTDWCVGCKNRASRSKGNGHKSQYPRNLKRQG